MRTKNDSPELRNNHNVYILGAGFSSEAGLPIVHDFLHEMRNAIDVLDQERRTRERDAVANVLTFRQLAASAAHRTTINVENVEELFSLASAVDRSRWNDDMVWAIAATLDCCRTSFNTNGFDITVRASVGREVDRWPAGEKGTYASNGHQFRTFKVTPCDLNVATLLGLLSPSAQAHQNTFISFNYDLAVEDAIHKLGRKVSYGIPEDLLNVDASYVDANSPTKLLKLHGSINWVADPSESKLRICQDYATVRQRSLAPVLTPPTWRKEFGAQLTHVWDEAVEALRHATRIVVLGFSMPNTDIHVPYLLAAGLRDNISLRSVVLVDPSERVLKKALRVLRPELYDRGVLIHEQKSVSQFVHNSALLINRRPQLEDVIAARAV